MILLLAIFIGLSVTVIILLSQILNKVNKMSTREELDAQIAGYIAAVNTGFATLATAIADETAAISAALATLNTNPDFTSESATIQAAMDNLTNLVSTTKDAIAAELPPTTVA